jgi:putative tryptophan/tyrosine transport system substrate-binding protein
MKRRKFIALLVGSTVAWPRFVRAANRPRRIGILLGNTEGDPQAIVGMSAFRQILEDLGWTEGRDLQVDLRWGETDPERMRVLAGELVKARPDVLFASSTPAAAALHGATTSIPIVFVIVSDPVGSGFVASLPRPGGNMTGFINMEASLGSKWAEILKEVSSDIDRAAILFNPETAPYYAYYVKPFEAAARSLSIEPLVSPVHSSEEIESAIGALAERAHGGLVMAPDFFMNSANESDHFISLAARYRMPAIYPYAYMVRAGGLISYGIDQVDLFRRASGYIDRVLKGARPEDLPVQLPTKFEMEINLKTAKASGFVIPPTLVGSADGVIE